MDSHFTQHYLLPAATLLGGLAALIQLAIWTRKGLIQSGIRPTEALAVAGNLIGMQLILWTLVPCIVVGIDGARDLIASIFALENPLFVPTTLKSPGALLDTVTSTCRDHPIQSTLAGLFGILVIVNRPTAPKNGFLELTATVLKIDFVLAVIVSLIGAVQSLSGVLVFQDSTLFSTFIVTHCLATLWVVFWQWPDEEPDS